jgi:hypothetical protein
MPPMNPVKKIAFRGGMSFFTANVMGYRKMYYELVFFKSQVDCRRSLRPLGSLYLGKVCRQVRVSREQITVKGYRELKTDRSWSGTETSPKSVPAEAISSNSVTNDFEEFSSIAETSETGGGEGRLQGLNIL